MDLENTHLADLFKSAAENLAPQLSIWRRHLHAHPELSYEEYETMKYVSGELDKIGVSHKSGIADTGIVATIESNYPSARFMALRADLDALPIQELNDVTYASCNPGVMHACGHDVHTTYLLGAAYILSKNKDQWKGTVRLIFQPGEERLPGGASLMVAEGVLKNPVPSHILGSHVFPELPAGHVGMRQGTYMASADEIHLTIIGKGGHAALTENQSNPLIVASEIILALEKLINERPDPSIKTVLAFGFIEGLGATNVIPNEVHLKGTFRSLNETWRYEVHDKIKTIIDDICLKRGATADRKIPVGYPSVYNDPDLTSRMKASAIEFLGEDKVHDLPVRMTAEDFSFYAREIPGCFYRIGTSSPNSELGHSGLHTPHFDVDEDSLKLGAGLMAYAAATT